MVPVVSRGRRRRARRVHGPADACGRQYASQGARVNRPWKSMSGRRFSGSGRTGSGRGFSGPVPALGRVPGVNCGRITSREGNSSGFVITPVEAVENSCRRSSAGSRPVDDLRTADARPWTARGRRPVVHRMVHPLFTAAAELCTFPPQDPGPRPLLVHGPFGGRSPGESVGKRPRGLGTEHRFGRGGAGFGSESRHPQTFPHLCTISCRWRHNAAVFRNRGVRKAPPESCPQGLSTAVDSWTSVQVSGVPTVARAHTSDAGLGGLGGLGLWTAQPRDVCLMRFVSSVTWL